MSGKSSATLDCRGEGEVRGDCGSSRVSEHAWGLRANKDEGGQAHEPAQGSMGHTGWRKKNIHAPHRAGPSLILQHSPPPQTLGQSLNLSKVSSPRLRKEKPSPRLLQRPVPERRVIRILMQGLHAPSSH
jgi:hypothetical protein